MQAAIAMENLSLAIPGDAEPSGARVLAGLVGMAEAAVGRLQGSHRAAPANPATAVVGRIRGTGRGVSFTRLIEEMERTYPLELTYPFEDSERVGGAVWVARDLLGGISETSVAKIRWDSRATDLPMHVHDHSDRFIIVLKGRGYFHVTDEPAERFTGTNVRTVPAREMDVFLFTRGTVHTFSTAEDPMVLLSCQLPYLPFNDPRQYRLPAVRWTAKEHRHDPRPAVACDPAWTILARGSEGRGSAFLEALAVGPGPS
jgi:mannose-6-phosphate isomerase-like protein (cupin superfamily)